MVLYSLNKSQKFKTNFNEFLVFGLLILELLNIIYEKLQKYIKMK